MVGCKQVRVPLLCSPLRFPQTRARVGYHLQTHGTSRCGLSHRSRAAVWRSVFVTAAHKSSCLPEEPHLKHGYAFRAGLAENERLFGQWDRCPGHGPRTWSPEHSAGTNPIRSRTWALETRQRTAWKSTPGMGCLCWNNLHPSSRPGYRKTPNREEEPVPWLCDV